MITKIFDIVAHAIAVGLIFTIFVLYFICINISLFVSNVFQSIYQK